MPESQKEFIPIQKLSKKLKLDKSNARKYILNQGFSFVKIRTPESRGQLTLALSAEDAESIIAIRESQGFAMNSKSGIPVENSAGFFYIIQLIPEVAPNRVKLGFATTVENRLNAHKTTAPTAVLINQWNCNKDWERTAIASITRYECKHVGGEVFDCEDLTKLNIRAKAFFNLMPEGN